ncbi:Cell wall alpha-1,3-glucan synthase ags1 [Lecanora helva]
MIPWSCLLLITVSATTVNSLRYDPSQAAYNINANQTAQDVTSYWGEWQNHTFHPSPSNWRLPFYTVLLDRFVNGNPENDNANGTQFEHDTTQTELRHGGDVKGLQDSLDYLQGMGIRVAPTVLYIAGSPFINFPWSADGYSPLDFTLLDYHFGTISEWQNAISAIHERGMYVMLDNTMSTMGDLIGFEGYLNTSTPFRRDEHNALWKSDRRYHDFNYGNNELPRCDYPRFYGDDGIQVLNLTSELVGCRDSEFDQYGEVAAFGDYPEWQRQLSKFAFVQDRLREWRPDVLTKLEHFACMAIATFDIDGYRMDKGLTITIDAQAHWSHSVRKCAKQYGKNNFYISGEVVAGNVFGSVYIGRGRTPENYVENTTEAMLLNDSSDHKYFIRDPGLSAFDGVAFHYTVYRFLSRFLGLDGTYGAEGDPPVGWIDFWQAILSTNDMVNANDGMTFDPRHMYGVTNQDVFRWPTIKNGTEKQLLGYFIVALLLPGMPTLVWGEEQAFYVLESTNANYVFGRSPMSSAQAWEMHGCYNPAIGNSKYYQWPIEAGLHGCQDDWIALDHRDPSHPVRNLIKATHQMRVDYPVFQDGFSLNLLSNQTYEVFLPGSNHTPTETGLWSVERTGMLAIQKNLTQSAWLVYMNENQTKNYVFDCADTRHALLAPFTAGSRVKNIFFPYEEYSIENSTTKIGANSDITRGCLSALQLPAWGFKAFVLKDQYVRPSPVITKFLPGHDSRLLSTPSVPIELRFSHPMNCGQIANVLRITSTTWDNRTARMDNSSVRCSETTSSDGTISSFAGMVQTIWSFSATLLDVSDGIHRISIDNVSTLANASLATNSHDHFLLRVGQSDNPLVFASANYSTDLLFKDANNSLYVSHKAAGADMFRYSLDFATTYSGWIPYPRGRSPNSTLALKNWSGTKLQEWNGEHVIIQYWNGLVGSSDHVQHADVGIDQRQREFPHAFIEGTFNQYGFDGGIVNHMQMSENHTWRFDYVQELPAQVSVNLWGVNPDGQPDKTRVYGDIDGDNVLDRIPPISLIDNVINITDPPPSPFLAWQIVLNDADYRYQLIPIGSRWNQLILYILLWLGPIISGGVAVWVFMRSFYGVKLNEVGITTKKSWGFQKLRQASRPARAHVSQPVVSNPVVQRVKQSEDSIPVKQEQSRHFPQSAAPKRLTVLIATMEYEIEDWAIKVKIGGLGVMSSLMGKNLKHQDLIWVIPCIGDIKYPTDKMAESIAIKDERIHQLRLPLHLSYDSLIPNYYIWADSDKSREQVVENITYVLLDAPIFRQQTKAEPYPTCMDDLDSAVYYSAWNSCIAEVMKRFPIDLYHINDYHGAVAPLHLLPRIVPCLLSLHNAEFQGLWPMRTDTESQEVCEIYNIDPAVVHKYVRFGEVFNLLHAGASYLRLHQKGFGAVGVSTKYGKRAFARYPIFWGMKDVGGLPNPDPTDTADWSGEHVKPEEIAVDEELEASKPKLKRQAQNWAGLKQDPDAELFVFVGRWSNQKGVDAIADVFPSIIERHPHVQLICVGPVIDLYGKFAALKLARMMEIYKGKVFSQPEFTALPSYIFSGADFALMPSRDEPFGLVAVEFGRKGVLCVGARVGGLGNMPGWWFTIESTTAKHFIQQFKMAIEDALRSRTPVRKIMRARALKQRFPVRQWVEDLEKLQSTAIETSHKLAAKEKRPTLVSPSTPAILETPGLLSVLQSRFTKPTLRPRTRPGMARALSQGVGLSPVAEGRLLAGPTPGLGSKMGPSSKRKRPPPPLLSRKTTGAVPKMVAVAGDQSKLDSSANAPRRPSVVRTPSTPDLRPEALEKQVRGPRIPSRPLMQRSPSMPQLRPNDRKAVKLLGMQVPASGMTALNSTKQNQQNHQNHSSSSSGEDSTAPSSAIESPLTPLTPASAGSGDSVYTTPPSTPSQNVSVRTSMTTVTSGSATGSRVVSRAPPISNIIHTPHAVDMFPSLGPHFFPHGSVAVLSASEVKEEKPDNALQKVTPFFSDPKKEYETSFQQKLQKLNGKNSENELCIEEFLLKSEKSWFGKLRNAELSKAPENPENALPEPSPTAMVQEARKKAKDDGFGLGKDHKPPSGLKRIMRIKIGDWPVYSFLLAFITLLTGTIGESATKVYAIAAVYLLGSFVWWVLYRKLQTVYILSAPFFLYGLSFLLIGVSPYGPSPNAGDWIRKVATGFYALSSSSGALYFALNFADEGGAPVTTFVYRACVIQGTQQIYVVALWYWGAALSKATGTASIVATLNNRPEILVPLCVSITCLMWAICGVLFTSLPNYYRQAPGNIPSFYSSLFRRKIIIWFFLVVVIQNYWLSAPYGRNWIYLWSSRTTPAWQVTLLVLVFFVGIWIVFLYLFSHLSRSHSWILPIFAMGIGAPRWAQMLWSTSDMGAYLPWAAGSVGSTLAGRALWLWLGLLDAIQGVGFGMILLQTLTRFHVLFTLIAGQILGSLTTIIAKATAPDRISTNTVFPNLCVNPREGLREPWFWVALLFQLAVPVGFAFFFRKEQLSKA